MWKSRTSDCRLVQKKMGDSQSLVGVCHKWLTAAFAKIVAFPLASNWAAGLAEGWLLVLFGNWEPFSHLCLLGVPLCDQLLASFPFVSLNHRTVVGCLRLNTVYWRVIFQRFFSPTVLSFKMYEGSKVKRRHEWDKTLWLADGRVRM